MINTRKLYTWIFLLQTRVEVMMNCHILKFFTIKWNSLLVVRSVFFFLLQTRVEVMMNCHILKFFTIKWNSLLVVRSVFLFCFFLLLFYIFFPAFISIFQSFHFYL